MIETTTGPTPGSERDFSMGADPIDVPVIPPPIEGVDRTEWNDLVERGRESGELHAEQVAHVLRHVELTGDAIMAVSEALASAGIEVDDSVPDPDDPTPTRGTTRRVD
ncbi:MAG TPA: RNA polymerase sigma factor region1.1 domain-containing protein, partial [Actinomycetota bacterium]